MTKLYSIAITSENITRYEAKAGSVFAEDGEKAREWGLEYAKNIWPISKGWFGHLCAFAEIERGVETAALRQIEKLDSYYEQVLEQARTSFRAALIAALIGFAFFLASVIALLQHQPQDVAIISLISGALVEIISGINFYLYARTASQLKDFHIRLDTTQRFVLANSICDRLVGKAEEKTRAELIRAIVQLSPSQLSSAIDEQEIGTKSQL